MPKCASCAAWKCKGEYSNRAKCQDRVNCTCVCQVTNEDNYFAKVGAFFGGVAAVAGGVVLTVATGGVAAVVIGGAMIGGGSALMINPVAKEISGEQVTAGDLAKDVAISGSIGVLSGGLGMAASAATKGAATAVKVTAQIGAAATTGATAGAVSEVVNNDDMTAGSLAKSMTVGAVCGAAGGAGGQLASAASSSVSNGIVKGATRVAVQTATATATDAIVQVAETGEVDGKRLLFTAGTSATIATTAQLAKSATMKTGTFADRRNNDLLKEKTVEGEKLSQAERREALETIKEAQKLLTAEVRAEEQKRAQAHDQHSAKIQKTLVELDQLKSQFVDLEVDRKYLEKDLKLQNSNPSKTDARIMRQQFKHVMGKVDVALNEIEADIKTTNEKKLVMEKARAEVKPGKYGNMKAHHLHGEHKGQVALDLPDEKGEQGRRGANRALCDVKDGKLVVSSVTKKHDYNRAPKAGERAYENPTNPVDKNLKNMVDVTEKKKKDRKKHD